ncbi:MAG TPA: hypothetical protein VL727_25240 [Puia sp.]|nr:hypothetical protein [Puia sp.]
MERRIHYGFVDQQLERLYLSEQRMGILFNTFALLAIFISCLGLCGLAAFTAEQRTKEIGIRKVLGANVAGLVAMSGACSLADSSVYCQFSGDKGGDS